MQGRLAQRQLLEAPFLRGELDEPTLAALREFQKQAGLPPVGLPSYASVRALGLEPDQVFESGDASCGEAP